MEKDRVMPVGERIISLLDQSGSTEVFIAVLAAFCLILGLLITRKFISIWQSQARKKEFYSDLITRYESDETGNKSDTAVEASDSSETDRS